jgi:hypothetical protein
MAVRVLSAAVPSPGTAKLTTCEGAGTETCVKLRNLSLAPGASVIVTMSVQTQSCTQGPFACNVVAKEADNFTGAGGNPVTTSAAPITVALSSNPGAGMLSGATLQAAEAPTARRPLPDSRSTSRPIATR